MQKLLSRIATALKTARAKAFDRKGEQIRRQGGYVVISLAAIGLFGSAAAAAPILNRVVGSITASESGPVNQSGATCAAEHALWRLKHDPSVWGTMSGSPPSVSYQQPACDALTNADITIGAMHTPPTGNDRFKLALTVSPDEVPEDTDVQFTYTLSITNDDILPQYVSRVQVDPKLFFKPDAVPGTTTGITTADPVKDTHSAFFGTFKWIDYTWDLYPPVEVPPFGGEIHLSFTAEDNENGSQFAGASAWFDGIGEISTPNATRVRFQDNNPDLIIEEFVTPDLVPAGVDTTFDYTLRTTNTGEAPLTLDWFRSWHATDFNYVSGSTVFDGVPFSDPSSNSGGFIVDLVLVALTQESRTRYRWNVPPTTINPGESIDLTYKMQGSLQPGMFYSRASALVEEAPGNIFEGVFELSTHTSGETAPIEATQGFTVTAIHEGNTVIVTGTITEDGIEIESWKEF